MKELKLTLNFEETMSNDVSVMVDALRASTTITIALDKYEKIVPVLTKEKAKKVAIEENGVLAGERTGTKINGFELGNSPIAIQKYKTDLKTLILTTSNGTRILNGMKSKVLIGSLINSQAVGKACLKLANSHIDVVMAGVKGDFAIEDYLVSGYIIRSIEKEFKKNKTKFKSLDNSEYAQSAVLGSENYELVKKSIYNSKSSNRLKELGYQEDIDFSLQRNISNNVGIYENNEIRKLNV
ncbi:MAG: 2-phosphosulfolactate phosphatase [Methanobrevibacter sp.]|jgi:2-phosphosulfolactate phosphatase|nr:2-phosphosulfolactate phosphatase [Candidatus Methanovirga basalitermitum]